MPKKQCIGKVFVVGSYHVTVEDVIAEGGFALVFLTRDNAGKRYALKRMFVNKEQDLLMCQQEIRILESFAKELDSPIVRYFASVIKDIDEEVKEILILLEYYKYSVLQLMNEKFQAKKNLGEEELLNIFCDVCHAVSKLHTHRPPWIHRDLKVENMLLDKNGRCVLCDFGSCTSVVLDPSRHPVADIEEDLKKYTTIAYRSPEMVNLYGFNKPITTKADIWALGVLLYKMCYFHLPFGESSLAIQNCNIHFPSHPAYSKHLQGLTRYCLQIDADERPDIYQVTQVACLLAGRECMVANVNKSAVPSSEYLLKLCDTPIVPLTLHTEAAPAVVPSSRLPPHVPTSQHEISSVTSIAPRERPKPSSSTTNANLILLPPPLKPQGASSISGMVPAASNTLSSEHAVERPSAAKLTGDRSQLFLNETQRNFSGSNRVNGTSSNTDAFNPMAPSRRPVKLGHRRNISDTSAVLPTVRAISPTPTQNNSSERSRSADNSPTRSPHPGGSIDKKFANWNPFEDAEAWNVAPAPGQTLVQSITSSLTKVGSVTGIASKLVPSSPTESRDSKTKLKEEKEKTASKKKKKFQYQKFDNDSEDEGQNTHSSNKSNKNGDDDDNDSIGSASDLKYEEDTSDDDGTKKTKKSSSHHVNNTTANQPTTKTDDEEEHMGYNDVQYGTLEETVSALRNVDPTSNSILQSEVSSKPLLSDGLNGMDKSDDDELSSASTVVVPQRRLTFDTAGLLSVFDQIPFRQPKKSKTSSSLKGDVSPTVSATNQNQTTPFPKTNPFAERSFASPPHEERNLLRDFEASPAGPARYDPTPVKPTSHPPLPPPKPASLRKEGREALLTLSSDVDRNGENRFGLSAPIKPFVASAGSVFNSFQSSSEHKQFDKSLLYDDLTDVSVTNELLSRKSPGATPNKAGRFPVKKGISNVSFEDA